MLRSNQGVVLPEKKKSIIKIKQSDKSSYSRRLSREVSMTRTNSSIEVYYGGASVAIPFGWESQPGTPKVKFCESPLPLLPPPLTPPPSFHSDSPRRSIKRFHSNKSSNLLHSVLPKLTMRRKTQFPSSSTSSSPSSASSSATSSPWSPSSPFVRGEFKNSSPRMSLDTRMREEEDDHGSPVSTLFFCGGANARSRGCSTYIIKALLRDFA